MTFQDDLREVLDKLRVVAYHGAPGGLEVRGKAQALSAITKLVEGLIGKNRHYTEDEVRGYNQAKQEIRERLR